MNLPDGLNGIQIEMRRRRASVIYGRFDVSGRCQVGGIINRGDAVYCHPPGSPYSEPGSLINISRESSRSLPSPNASLMDDSAHAGRSLIIIMIPSSSKSLGGGGGAAGFFEDVFWGSLRVAPPRGIQPQDEFFFSPTLTCDGGSLEDSHRLLNSNLTGKKKRTVTGSLWTPGRSHHDYHVTILPGLVSRWWIPEQKLEKISRTYVRIPLKMAMKLDSFRILFGSRKLFQGLL